MSYGWNHNTIPHAVMSSCRADGIITDYNTISHAVGWLVPVSRTDGNITDYNTLPHAVMSSCRTDGITTPSPVRLAGGWFLMGG